MRHRRAEDMVSAIDEQPVGAHGAVATLEQLDTLRERVRNSPPRDPWNDLGNATDRRSAAAHLIRLGLHPIAIHGLRDGKCTCPKECGKSAGKHPVLRGWQHADLDGDSLDKMLATNWSYNLGLRMGPQPNGWFLIALDVDGPRELLKPLEAEHGALPPTLTARTGSGGSHLVYRVSDPKRAPGNRVKLAPGIDVRSEGGQIVCAPSRHLSGAPYAWAELRVPEVLF